MKLDGKQFEQIRNALLDAFDKPALRTMTRVELGVTLEHVADGENLGVVVDNLIFWVERQGRIEDLIEGAHRANKGNPKLRKLLADSRSWSTAGTSAGAPARLAPDSQPAEQPPAAIPGAQTSSSAPAPAPTPSDIFLSYSRQDAAAMRAVQETLRAAGLSVWTDEGLRPGTRRWTEAIEAAIEGAARVVVLLSPAAKASTWVNNEINYAQAHNKPIYPLLIAGDAGSAVPISLISVQWIDARQDLRGAVAWLLAVLIPQIAPTSTSSPQPAPAPAIHLHTMKGHTDTVCSLAFSPDGMTLVSGSFDKTVRLWDVTTGKQLRTLKEYANRIYSIALHPDGKTFVSINGGTNNVYLWDIATGEQLWMLKGNSTSVAFNPDGKLLASGSDDNTVRLWDAATGKHLATLEGHTRTVNSVTFSPDGKTLASGSNDETVRLWDLHTGELLHTLKGHTWKVDSVAFSPDGRMLASGSWDGTTLLWYTATGEQLWTLKGNGGLVSTVAFSPDGKVLASGGTDTSVRLWDTATGEQLRTLEDHSDIVMSVAFSPDGKLLASGSYDKTIRLWPVEV